MPHFLANPPINVFAACGIYLALAMVLIGAKTTTANRFALGNSLLILGSTGTTVLAMMVFITYNNDLEVSLALFCIVGLVTIIMCITGIVKLFPAGKTERILIAACAFLGNGTLMLCIVTTAMIKNTTFSTSTVENCARVTSVAGYATGVLIVITTVKWVLTKTARKSVSTRPFA